MIESEQLVNIDVLAKRNLYDQMPAIITRSIIRAAVKGGTQYAAYEKGGTLVGIGVNILNIATEGADTRSWRTLPAEIRAIRHSLPVGEHKIAFVLNGVPTNEITLTVKAKEHRLIIVRVVDAGVFVIYGENDTTFLSLL